MSNPQPPLAAGTWCIDADASHARFTAATLGGLVKTPGRFRRLAGSLTVTEGRAEGVLAIDAGSIYTGNRVRDGHLRGGDFFAVAKHPELRYELDSLTPLGSDALRVDGRLTIAGKQTALPLDAGLRVHSAELVELSARTRVDRVALGIRGARGMVPRTVELDIRITLRANGG